MSVVITVRKKEGSSDKKQREGEEEHRGGGRLRWGGMSLNDASCAIEIMTLRKRVAKGFVTCFRHRQEEDGRGKGRNG